MSSSARTKSDCGTLMRRAFADVAQLAQTPAQGVEIGRVLRLRYRLENADAVDPCCLLSARGECRREKAGGEGADERSSIHCRA